MTHTINKKLKELDKKMDNLMNLMNNSKNVGLIFKSFNDIGELYKESYLTLIYETLYSHHLTNLIESLQILVYTHVYSIAGSLNNYCKMKLGYIGAKTLEICFNKQNTMEILDNLLDLAEKYTNFDYVPVYEGLLKTINNNPQIKETSLITYILSLLVMI